MRGGAEPAAVPTSWAAQQLTEFLAAVSGARDERAAIHDAVERATEAFEAEVGAVIGTDGQVIVAAGFGINEVPVEALRGVGSGECESLEGPGIGTCQALATPIGDQRLALLVLARDGELVVS